MKRKTEPKPLFLERMQKILTSKEDFEKYLEFLKKEPKPSIRCNTLKISPNELKKRLEAKGWKISQPFSKNLEIMIIDEAIGPGELGRALEHMLGYYYVQEIASMLPILALQPQEGELVLDLCASPGSKTTQMAATMNGSGCIIANEMNMGRLKILAANTERCGVSNAIITRKEGTSLCYQMQNSGVLFDKILVDAPCSGEGTLRTSPRTAEMWSINTVKKLSKIQKHLFASAFEILKVGGEIVYSTCTHSPEENEEIVDFALKEFKGRIEVKTISLPIKCRPGLSKWEDKEYEKNVFKACRVYPQDNDTEGFFIVKFRRIR